MQTWGRSNVLDITILTGVCPLSLRVVSLGLSLLTVSPPTITASDLALVSKTLALDCGVVTHALWPDVVAIFPSKVIAYLRIPKGFPVAALWSKAYRAKCSANSDAKLCRPTPMHTVSDLCRLIVSLVLKLRLMKIVSLVLELRLMKMDISWF